MTDVLIHGCYDQVTFQTLLSLGVRNFAFDLRGRSPNLIPFRGLKNLLSTAPLKEVFLVFEDDQIATVESFLNLLKDLPFRFTLIFRGKESSRYLREVNHPFYWMAREGEEWKEIIELPLLKGILVPLKGQELHADGHFWERTESRGIDVFLHAQSFEELSRLPFAEGVKVSLDLTQEIETKYRQVDQAKLKDRSLWRKLNENPSL
jgi:hypothetical protein